MTEERIEDTAEQAPEETSTKPSRAEILEEEGEIAADYLEELLDLADIDGDIDIDVADGRAQLSIVCEDEDSNLGTLVGKEGRTLGALQELSRLAVQTQTGQRSWLMLDIDGFRDNRREELIKKAKRAIEQVKVGGEEFAFKPMNSFERKIIHDQAARAGLVSESEGEGDGRHVVIRLADD
ncbi:R3H domain-containing nucleic acid-binding protein [Brevibacterium sp. SMBL_HHYL_HB1]|jgi:spoIIIJ-associated protein|uniref:Jag family protein n=1 Tax=Brevibacterium sp. SMBL_HHYL_HB1 TaxID=2777556 RepID=UPI001BACA248|nr:R3H domain-containing nucleic acid-binding protein [Brevibacterium sp. SMBL_HHYL_HB1]QUL78951.1 KH domain-containing protein [Brevibacterium sp. SMBL_HHYL_HB1]